jgi:hypothetical protein
VSLFFSFFLFFFFFFFLSFLGAAAFQNGAGACVVSRLSKKGPGFRAFFCTD